jgi:hypothetical protein
MPALTVTAWPRGGLEEDGDVKVYRGLIVVMSLAAVLMRPSVAAAQLSTRELPLAVEQKVAVGQKVTVITGDGRKTNGKVLSLTPTTMEISDGGGIHRFEIADVTRIQESDSTTNGIIKGAFWTGLTGFLVGTLADAASAAGDVFGGTFVLLLGGTPEPIKETNHGITGALIGIGAGALFGYAIDAGKERTLYEREGAGMSVAVRPIVSAAGKGVGLRIRW